MIIACITGVEALVFILHWSVMEWFTVAEEKMNILTDAVKGTKKEKFSGNTLWQNYFCEHLII